MSSIAKVVIITFSILTILGILSVCGAYFYFTRTALPLSLSYKAEGVATREEWTISFGRDIALADFPKLVPHLEGMWYQKRGLFGVAELSFRPTESFVKGVRYVAHIPLARAYDTSETIELPRIAFMTEPAPKKREELAFVAPVSSSTVENINIVATSSTSSVRTHRTVRAPAPLEVFKLEVPYFKQEYSRSCEAASLRMVLAYYGVTVNDMEILQKFGYAPRPKNKENNIWDDPHEMFVGDASKDTGEGYGVYGEPVVQAAKFFGRDALYSTKITPQYLAKNVRAGHPVILWGYIVSAGPKIRWHSPKGKEVVAIADEHARVVVGVRGSTENPAGFYLHDPRSGAQYEYWSKEKLMTHISTAPGVTNQAVVVR